MAKEHVEYLVIVWVFNDTKMYDYIILLNCVT